MNANFCLFYFAIFFANGLILYDGAIYIKAELVHCIKEYYIEMSSCFCIEF